jgi:hypothetical protein
LAAGRLLFEFQLGINYNQHGRLHCVLTANQGDVRNDIWQQYRFSNLSYASYYSRLHFNFLAQSVTVKM